MWLVCHSGPDGSDFRGDAYALAVTSDLRAWTGRFITGVRGEPEVSGERLRVGDVTWTPDGGFVSR